MDMLETQNGTAAPRKLLPALEMEVMKALWMLGSGTVSQVQANMQHDKQLAYTTVMTMLDRLSKKGVVTRAKNGRSYCYTAVLHKDDALRLALDRLVHDFFGDSSQKLLNHLIDAQHQTRPSETAGHPMDSALL